MCLICYLAPADSLAASAAAASGQAGHRVVYYTGVRTVEIVPAVVISPHDSPSTRMSSRITVCLTLSELIDTPTQLTLNALSREDSKTRLGIAQSDVNLSN